LALPPRSPCGPPLSENRFSALRSFGVYTCRKSPTADCSATGLAKVGTFVDVFRGGAPRPVAPQLPLRQFDVTDSMATHIRLVAFG